VAPKLVAWVERLLEKDPADRPESAKQAWNALEDVLIDLAGPRWRREAPIMAAPTSTTPASDEATATAFRPVPAVVSGGHDDGLQRPSALAREYRSGFVGRGRELDRLWDAWRRAEDGRRELVILSGEPGIGKSRLAAEFAGQVLGEDAAVLFGRCSQEPLLPYQPFVEAVRPLLPSARAGLAGDLERLIPGHGDEAMRTDLGMQDAARFRLFEAVRQLLSDAAERQPLLLVLEDLHWADKPSLLLLSHLAGSPEPARLLVLATYRETDLHANEALAELLADLRRERVGIRLPLGGLDRAEVDALMAAWGNETTPAEEIHRRTEGNPFFVEELLSHLEESDSEPAGVPEGVTEVIDRRVGRLRDITRSVLAAASILGRRFDLHIVEGVVEAGPDAVADALEEATSAGLVREEHDPATPYAFSHALMREAIYEGLAAPQRQRLHARAATVLEDFYGERPERVGQVAHHLFAAVNPALAERGIKYAAKAAALALGQLAYEDAVLHLERALRALDIVQRPDERRRCELLLLLGDARARAGDRSGARTAFAAAGESARRLDAPELLARAALGFGGLGVTILAVDDEIVARLEEALGALGGGDRTAALRVRLLSRLAVELYYDPQRERSEKLGTEALDLARSAGDESVLAYALNARHVSLWRADRLEERLALAREMVALGERTGERESELQARNWLVTDLFESGLMAELETAVDDYEELARDLRLAGFEWYATLWRGALAALRGDPSDVEPVLEEAVQAGRRCGDPNVELADHVRVGAHVMTGHSEAAYDVYGRFASKLSGSPASLAFRCGWAWYAAASGRPVEARGHLDHLAAHGLDRLPFDVNWLDSVSCLAEACALLGDRERAATIYELLLPYQGRVATVAGRALVSWGATDRHVALVAGTIGRYEEAERHFEAAVRHNERLGFRPWAAWTRYQHARMLCQRDAPGDAEQARALLAPAADIARELSLDGLESLVGGVFATRP
jgi:tetratricopeptide (TPR) repeat protein